MCEKTRNKYRILVGRALGKWSLEKRPSRLKYTIKTDLGKK
jgi:hypothetical protein